MLTPEYRKPPTAPMCSDRARSGAQRRVPIIASLNEGEFFEKLMERANGVQSDIKGDFPEHDTAYDLYVEARENGEIIGVIDMGDLYCEVFMDCDDGEIDIDPSLNPHDMIEEILSLRIKKAGGWLDGPTVHRQVHRGETGDAPGAAGRRRDSDAG